MSLYRVLAGLALIVAICGGTGVALKWGFLPGAITFVIVALGAGILHNIGDKQLK